LWPKMKKDKRHKRRKQKQPAAPALIEIRLKKQAIEFLTPTTVNALDNT
jgi:hypothetical protein